MKEIGIWIALILLFSACNRGRGTWSWFAHVHGAILSIVMLIGMGSWAALFAYPLFIFGESFGWGTSIGGLLNTFNEPEKAKNDELYRAMLSNRACWWWTGIMCLFAWLGSNIILTFFCLYILSVGFPICVELSVSKLFDRWDRVELDRWHLSEWFYGAVQGAVFAALLTI